MGSGSPENALGTKWKGFYTSAEASGTGPVAASVARVARTWIKTNFILILALRSVN
jgi:hypothetical protein